MRGDYHIDTTGLARVRKKLLSGITDKQTKKLLGYAPLVLKEAYNNKGFKNRTWNLADSFVWAVYYKGNLKGSGYLWNSRIAKKNSYLHEWTERIPINGRRAAQDFLSTYNSEYMSGWEIVWAATAPYGRILEKGWSMHGRAFQFNVITSIIDQVGKDFGNHGVLTNNL